MQKFPAIELLKFRASTGLAGNPSIQPYQSMAHLLSQQYTFGGAVVPGYYPASVGNPNLGWESTRQTDYGVDLGLYGGRVSFTGDIYRKTTSDLLLAVNLPFESGFGTALQNVGSVSNNGYELGLTLTVLDGRTPFARVDDDGQLLAQQEPGARPRRRAVDLRRQREQRPQAPRIADSGRPGTRRLLRIQDERNPARLGGRGGIRREGEAAGRHDLASWRHDDRGHCRRSGERPSDRPRRRDHARRPHDHRRSKSQVHRGLAEPVHARPLPPQRAIGRDLRQQDSEPERRSSHSGQPWHEHHFGPVF